VGKWVALDKPTSGDVIGRLVGRGLVRRRRDQMPVAATYSS
jgi:DNA-binding MarR family transcriptional regulator